MCTLVILRRPGHDWPVLIAANRDEMADRAWHPPGRHWPDRPDVTAGQDVLAGGSWLGINDTGVVAGILNRKDSLGPDPDLRSRGELVLDALDHADAADSAGALAHLAAESYRSFNMVVADNRDAFWLRGLGTGPVSVHEVPAGLSMFTSLDMNDAASPRVRHFLPLFREAAVPDPERGDWHSWTALLASREHAAGTDIRDAMTIETDFGFATLSSSLIALPAAELGETRPVWRFAGRGAAAGDFRDIPL